MFSRTVLFLSGVICSGSLAAADYLPLPLQPGQAIRVYGTQGRLEIVLNEPGQIEHLRVKSTSSQQNRDFSVQMQHKGNVLEIRSKESQDLVLSLNPRSLYVSWLRGQVDVLKWTAPVEIYMEKGRLNIQGGEGSRVIVGHQIRLNMEHEKGPFKLSVYDLNFSGRFLKGALQMEGSRMSGELAESEAPLVGWKFWDATMKVKKPQGATAQYVARAGEVRLSN